MRRRLPMKGEKNFLELSNIAWTLWPSLFLILSGSAVERLSLSESVIAKKRANFAEGKRRGEWKKLGWLVGVTVRLSESNPYH